MAKENLGPEIRKLGEYINCPAEHIESVLTGRGSRKLPNTRMGEALVKAKIISAEELFSSILAQRLDRLHGVARTVEIRTATE